MTLVMLHDDAGRPCYINPEFVAAVEHRRVGPGGSKVYVQGVEIRVEETPEQVARAMDREGKTR